MKYTKEFMYQNQYEWASSNQHGDRYKRTTPKKITIGILSCTLTDPKLADLVLLSNILDIPVKFDFGKQEAFIKLVAGKAVL